MVVDYLSPKPSLDIFFNLSRGILTEKQGGFLLAIDTLLLAVTKLESNKCNIQVNKPTPSSCQALTRLKE